MAAEAVVSAVVEELVLAAATWLKEEISLLKGVKPKLHNMENKLRSIQVVLEDAQDQSVKKKNVKHWLEKLKEVSYDTDDLLDEWITRARVHQLEAEEFTCFSLKKLNCFSSAKQLLWRREIALRIKDINRRTDLVFSEKNVLELAEKAVGSDAMDKIINDIDIARTTTSFIDESKMFGRGDDKKILLRKVLPSNTEHESSLQVISIVGAGGLGKTTLTQMVYNDGKVKEKFGGNRIWVCVSNPFDEVKVAKDILAALKVDHTNMISLENFHQSIRESLSGHKFLLVLDDVWEEIPDKWEKLRICLMLGHPDSRVLVTTRKVEVASIMGTPPPNILKPRLISDLDCWALMSQIVFQGRTNEGNEDLDDIGRKIAKKCNGLPLAAKTLGGMLRSTLGGTLQSKECVDRWNEILYSEIWQSEQAEVELFPHIFLSYQELPVMLKYCFLILAIFPKDTKLQVEDVIGIWMAHGFLNPRIENGEMVNTGRKYLKFLVSRALLEEETGYINKISMHDIIHDFALHVLGDEIISISGLDKIENDSGSMSKPERRLCLKSTTARHLYIGAKIGATSIGLDVKKLRTCIIRKVAPNITSDLVKGLKMVRALYLNACGLEEVPESIEKLIHLRLLDLSHNRRLVELPETIGGLYNLQTLLLQDTGISRLPDSIGKLTNLILLTHDWKVKKYPESVGKLINLQHLGCVPVDAGRSKLGFLKDLNQLRGVLVISFWSSYDDEVDVKKAAIQNKNHITELRLYFKYKEVTDGVIAALQPPSNLQQLTICNLVRSSLPGWITSLHHLTELKVFSCLNISTLPPLGELQFLKNLHLYRFSGLKKIGRECWGQKNDHLFLAFPNLLHLEIEFCLSLEEWSDIKAEDEAKLTLMPKLQQLTIRGCPKLEVLPSRLLCRAASLEELRCYDINSTLEEYIKNEKQLLGRVNKVYIDYTLIN